MLINPGRHFIANSAGLGYLVPLGLILIGGALIDKGYTVNLIDHDKSGWKIDRLLREIKGYDPKYVLLGHSGSTASHNTVVQIVRKIKNSFPAIRIIYGGVYPSYAYQNILQETPEVDVIVRGEGEKTIVDVIAAWEQSENLERVAGIVWRKNSEIIVNRQQEIIQNLDDFRPAWELLDISQYTMLGFKNVVGFQFSRGCPLTCSYCGQWLFWKKWRHRSPENVVTQLKLLAEKYGVTMVWFADENFAADRATTIRLLQKIIDAELNLSLNINMTAADVVRDADIIPLYKAAGVDYVVLGVESLNDSVITNIRKNNPFAVSKKAVRLLRENHVLSLTNIIFGLEEESWKTIAKKIKGMWELDSDILNAVYFTPHFWTLDGKNTAPQKVIQKDLQKWSYRNQVLSVKALSPLALFVGVKITEALFHLRPTALKRLIYSNDKKYLKIYRRSIWAGAKVFFAEILEFIMEVRFVPQGSISEIPAQLMAQTDNSRIAK